MKRIRSYYILALFVASNTIVFGQKEDFIKINEAYKNAPNLSAKIQYQLFANYTTNYITQKEDGEIKKQGDMLYSKIGKIESIKSASYLLVVDEEEKILQLTAVDKKEKKGKKEEALFSNPEEYLKLCDKVEFKKVNELQDSYTLSDCSLSDYQKITIIYNKQTHFIEKMILYYSEGQSIIEGDNVKKEAERVTANATKPIFLITFKFMINFVNV